MAELDPRRWKALAVVAAAYFMTILDVSIVNVALPTIGKDLNFSRDDLQWVVTAYAITFGGFLLLGGRAADILGRRRVFLVGVVVFTTASLFCGLAWSEGVLIAARAVQGFGAAIISPAALSIITTTFAEGAERNKALGVWGAMGGSGAAVGVLLGGVLTKYAGLGVDLLHQRARRRGRVPACAAVRAREPRRQVDRSGHRGRRDGDGRRSRCSSTRSRTRPCTAGGRAGRSPGSRSPLSSPSRSS